MVFLLRFSTALDSAQSALQLQYKTWQVHVNDYIKTLTIATIYMVTYNYYTLYRYIYHTSIYKHIIIKLQL